MIATTAIVHEIGMGVLVSYDVLAKMVAFTSPAKPVRNIDC